MARSLLLASDGTPAPVSAGQCYPIGGTYLLGPGSSESENSARARVAGHFCFLGGQASGLVHGQQLQFRKNGAAGSQLVTLTTGWNQASVQDAVLAGDTFAIGITSGTGSTSLGTMRAVFSSDTGHRTYHLAIIGANPITNSTSFWVLAGHGSVNSVSALAENQIKYTVPGTLAHLQVAINSNGAGSASTLRLKINGSNANSVITIPAGATGLFEDLVHIDTVAAGDLVSLEFTTGTGIGNVYAVFAGMSFTATSGSASDIFGTTSFAAATVTGTRYFPIAGYARTGNVTESSVVCRVGFPATLRRLRMYASANARSAATTVRLRINGANGNQALTIPAGTMGWFEDAAASDIVGADDDVALSITTAAPAAAFGVSTYGLQVTDNGGGTPCGAPPPVPTGRNWVARVGPIYT